MKDVRRLKTHVGQDKGYGPDRPYMSNHTIYRGAGTENWEHDDTGSEMNLSGSHDDMMNAQIESEGWQEGYDY